MKPRYLPTITPAITVMALTTLLALTPAYAAQDFRARLSVTQPQPEYTVDDVEAEIHFGRELSSKVLGRYPVWKNDSVNQYINKIGQLLVPHTQRQELNWHFVALDTDEVNAFAAPGGYVFITRGALNQTRNEAEVAAILAHEIGHVEHRHYVEAVGLRSSQGSVESGLTAVLVGGGSSAAVAFDQAVNTMMQIFFETGLQSHEDEFEADQSSIWLLTMAGYKPSALKDYFTRINAIKNSQASGISRTHPDFAERIERLNRELTNNQLNQLELATLEERLHENLR